MAKKVTFESRLERLEEIVHGLESPDLALEDAVEKYREGMTLAKELTTHLASMEKKIEELTADGGKVPFEAQDDDEDDSE